MICGDLDLTRAECDPAYLRQARGCLVFGPAAPVIFRGFPELQQLQCTRSPAIPPPMPSEMLGPPVAVARRVAIR